MSDVALVPAESAVSDRRPSIGYAMALSAGTLFALNGVVSKVILKSGLPSLRLTEVRCLGALLGLMVIVLLTRPSALRIGRRDLRLLAVFGVFAVALGQLFYFLAIARLDIGIAVLIPRTGVLLVALVARFAFKEHVRRRLWAALALTLVGLSLVVDVWSGVPLDGLGVLFAFGLAVTFAAFMLIGEHAVGRRDPISLLCYGFLFASFFWALAQPWWSFPFDLIGRSVSLLGNISDLHLPMWALIAAMVTLGTIAPFFLLIGSMQHITATSAAIVAMIEPVVASLVAYGWLDETLAVPQVIGGVIVLIGIALAQSAR